jgi:hypothetical protein
LSSSRLPDAIFKRDVLFGARKVPTAELQKLAKDFENAGWTSDAVDFLTQAKDEAALRKLRAAAVEDGDTFFFLKISRSLGDLESVHDELKRCAEKALALGKIRYAIKGFEKAGDEARAEEIRLTVAEHGDIKAEMEAKKVFIPEHELEVESEESDT